MAREDGARWYTSGRQEGRKDLRLAGSSTDHLFWQDTYYQPRALEKHADSILALVSQLLSGRAALSSPGEGSIPGGSCGRTCPSAYGWHPLLGIPPRVSFFWGSLSPRTAGLPLGTVCRSLSPAGPSDLSPLATKLLCRDSCCPWQSSCGDAFTSLGDRA